MLRKPNFEANLTTRKGMEVISLRYGEEAAEIITLENCIRERLDEHGNPITDSEVGRYKSLLAQYRRNTKGLD